MIVSCEHNQGRMGLCSDCSAEAERSVREEVAARTRRRRLEEALQATEDYGLPEAANIIRKALAR
jgi:hypothetical protein